MHSTTSSPIDSSPHAPHALIVGAGIAGLAAAWWLTHIGWSIRVLERAHHLRDGGHMMGISGPGLGTIRRMGLVDALRAAAYPDMGTHTYRDRRGRDLLSVDYRKLLKEMDWITLRRTELVRILREAVGERARIDFGITVESIAEAIGDDPLTATLTDGSTCTADLLIAADGVHSSLRTRTIATDAECLRPLGYRYAAYDLPAHWDLAESFLSYAEPGLQSEYYHLQNDRIAALHVWRSSAHGMVPAPERRPLLAQVTARSHPVVQNGLAAVEPGAEVVIDDLALVELPAWHKGRVLLLGDAAHSLSLISGQGAGMALASASVLAEELERHAGASHPPTAQHLATALAAHDRRLRPTVERLQQRSRKIAPAFVPATPVTFFLRNLALRALPQQLMRRIFISGLKSEAEAMAALQ
ncbi:FAD-dependent monooxygenase (plasmid) [Acidovorax sp. DW039]|uniref:FAD-dependent monooxygenase n=1 Tax=Acidovorax sp. DW039 TaxID=3095606 RepID=UPI0030914969|nr:FAD-dependent monooxygenase [Acidovorax sp. DW039]